MIRTSAAAIVPADGSVVRPRELRFGENDFDLAVWREMASLGWPSLLVPEEKGGAGFGAPEYCALAEMLGRGLVPEPFVACAAIAPVLPDEDCKALMAGERIVLPALQGAIELDQGQVTGSVTGVLAGRHADAFLVSAGGRLLLVDRADTDIFSAATQDGGTIARISMNSAPARPAQAGSLVEDHLALGYAAYLLGVADRAFETTLEYMRSRQQFGKPIGSFQALQHRCADMLVQLELSRSAISAAASAFSDGRQSEAISMTVSRAKARAGDTAMLVTRQAVQLHGGIGYADESDIGLYLRKAMTILNQGGSSQWHRKRYSGLLAA